MTLLLALPLGGNTQLTFSKLSLIENRFSPSVTSAKIVGLKISLL